MSPTDDQLTGYAKALKKRDKYPLSPHPLWKDRQSDKKHPVATPFLVIPTSAGDPVTNRPLEVIEARHFDAIEIVDANTQSVVTTPSTGKTYRIRCTVRNPGTVASYAGIAEFYLASPETLHALATGQLNARPAPLGYAGFTVPPGGEIYVTCPKPWTFTDLNVGILVRIYDPIVDKAASYNSARDRHVARRDIVPNFSGTYGGNFVVVMEGTSLSSIRLRRTLKVVIEQKNHRAKVSIQIWSPEKRAFTSIQEGQGIVDGSSFDRAVCKLVVTVSSGTDEWEFRLEKKPFWRVLHGRHPRKHNVQLESIDSIDLDDTPLTPF